MWSDRIDGSRGCMSLLRYNHYWRCTPDRDKHQILDCKIDPINIVHLLCKASNLKEYQGWFPLLCKYRFASTYCKIHLGGTANHSGNGSMCKIYCCSNIPSHRCCWISKANARRDSYCRPADLIYRDNNLDRRDTISVGIICSDKIDWMGRIHL